MVWRAKASTPTNRFKTFQSREPGFWFGELECGGGSGTREEFQSREPGFWFGERGYVFGSRHRSQFQSREPGFWFGERWNSFLELVGGDGRFSPVSRDFGLASMREARSLEPFKRFSPVSRDFGLARTQN